MSFGIDGNVSLALTTSSARVALPTLSVPDVGGNCPTKQYGRQIRVVSDADCYIKLGDSTVAATSSDTFLKANVIEVFDWNLGGHTHIAGIVPTSTGTLRITCGQGEPS